MTAAGVTAQARHFVQQTAAALLPAWGLTSAGDDAFVGHLIFLPALSGFGL
jgi:hypothetical protein